MKETTIYKILAIAFLILFLSTALLIGGYFIVTSIQESNYNQGYSDGSLAVIYEQTNQEIFYYVDINNNNTITGIEWSRLVGGSQ